MATGKTAIPHSSWDAVGPRPIVLISGPEDLLADRARQRLRDGLRRQHPDLETASLDASAYAAGQLLAAASPSLFAQPRLIEVDRLEQMTDAFLADALAYLDGVDPEVTLVLRHRKGVRGKRLLTEIRARRADAVEVECAELKRDDDKLAFVRALFSTASRSIDPLAARALVEAFSVDATELAAACQQLIADIETTITVDDVDRYFGGRVETTGFKIADAALAGQRAQALVLLRHATLQGVNLVPIVAALASKIRLMAAVHDVPGASAKLAASVGAAPWQIDRARREADRWHPRDLARAVRRVAEVDAVVKGAGGDPAYAVERLIVELSQRGVDSVSSGGAQRRVG